MYSGELVGNVSGGSRRGATYAGAAGVQAMLLLGRLVGWRGASVFAFLLGTHGGAPSDLVGDVQGVSNLQAPATVRVEELWFQQNLFGDRLSWLAGRYDLNTEFYRLQSAALFINSSPGMGPELALSGVCGPSIYPSTAVGTRLDYKPSPNSVVRAAVLDGVPVDRPGKGDRIFASGDGVLVVGEVALLSRPDTVRMPRNRRFRVGRGPLRPYAAKVAIGGWYYTARFPDLVNNVASGERAMHRGSGGMYLLGDATLWRDANGGAGPLTAFAQLGVGDRRVNQIAGYLGAGLTLVAPFPGRSADEFGLSVAAALNGSHFDRAQRAAGIATRSETALEVTYLAQITDWLALQADVQYILHPGGTRIIRNALVPGALIQLSR
jgi:porin